MNEQLHIFYFAEAGRVAAVDGPYASYSDAVTQAREVMPDERYTVAEVGYLTSNPNDGNLTRAGWHCLAIIA